MTAGPQFYGTVLYVDDVAATVDFYRRAFGLELRFSDESLGFAELATGGSTLAIAETGFVSKDGDDRVLRAHRTISIRSISSTKTSNACPVVGCRA